MKKSLVVLSCLVALGIVGCGNPNMTGNTPVEIPNDNNDIENYTIDSIKLNSDKIILSSGDTYDFTATVLGKGNVPQGVIWSIETECDGDTSFRAGNKLYVSSNEKASFFTVKVTSEKNAGIFNTIDVYIINRRDYYGLWNRYNGESHYTISVDINSFIEAAYWTTGGETYSIKVPMKITRWEPIFNQNKNTNIVYPIGYKLILDVNGPKFIFLNNDKTILLCDTYINGYTK